VPAVQSLRLTAVPDAPDALAAVADRVLADDLGSVHVAEDVDVDPVLRALAAARALGGTPSVAGVLAGDGEGTATFAVRAGTTWWRLEVTGSDPVTALALTAFPTGEHRRLEHRFG
jgi:hypothetical protein